MAKKSGNETPDLFSGVEGPGFNQYAAVETAAPVGAQEQVRNAQSNPGEIDWFSGVSVNDQGQVTGLASRNNIWFTGGSSSQQQNGWESSFMESHMKSYDGVLEGMRNEKINSFDDIKSYKDEEGNGFTGVITWGEKRAAGDNESGPRWGDIWENGVRVGNIYHDMDEASADLMMTPFVMSGKEQAKVFGDTNPEKVGNYIQQTPTAAITEAVEGKRQAATEDWAETWEALDYRGQLLEREQEMKDSGWGYKLAGGSGVATGAMSAGGVAALGAAGVTSWTGPGAIIAGAIVGASVGFSTALMNQDSLVEQAARADLATDRIEAQFKEAGSNGTWESGAKLGVGLSQWSGLGMRLIAPLSNGVQGLADADYGTIGDGNTEFYATDDNGERKISGWYRGADMAATVGDSVLQMGSPIGRALYMGATGVHISGLVSAYASTTGSRFDERTGRLKDLDGTGSHLAAWGAMGIDAAQMIGARGFARAAVDEDRLLRQSMGASADDVVGRSKAMYQSVTSAPGRAYDAVVRTALPNWKGAAQAGERTVHQGGRKFIYDTEGKVRYQSGWSHTLFAPSVLIERLNADVVIRDQVMKQGRQALRTEGDDMLRIAQSVAAGGKGKFNRLVVQGVGEGAEEFMQSILDPISLDHRVDWSAAGEAFMYGMAGGLGFALGPTIVGARQADREYNQYRINNLAAGLNPEQLLSKEEFEGLDPAHKTAVQKQTPQDKEAAAAFAAGVKAMKTTQLVDNASLPLHVVDLLIQKDLEAQGRGASPVANNVRKLHAKASGPSARLRGGLSSTSFANVSFDGAAEMIRDNAKMMSGMLEDLRTELAANTKALAALEDPAARAELEAAVAEAQEQEKLLAVVIEIGVELHDQLTTLNREFLSNKDIAARRVVIEKANAAIIGALQGRTAEQIASEDTADALDPKMEARAGRWAIEQLIGRDPTLNRGSNFLLLPQIDYGMTLERDKSIQVDQTILKSINGDHDGDKMRSRLDILLNEEMRQVLRTGRQMLLTVHEDATGKFRQTKTGKYVLDQGDGSPVLDIETGEVYLQDPSDPTSTLVGEAAGAVVERRNDAGLDARLLGGTPTIKVNTAALDAEPAILRNVARAFSTGRGAANGILAEFKTFFRERFKTAIADVQLLETILNQFGKDLEAGNLAARENFLDSMATAFSEELIALGEEVGNNEFALMHEMVTLTLTNIQHRLALEDHVEARLHPAAVSTDATATREAETASSRFNQGAARAEAATVKDTVSMIFRGDEHLRSAQALHYVVFKAMTRVFQMPKGERSFSPEIAHDLVEFFEGRNSGLQESAIETLTRGSSEFLELIKEDLNKIAPEVPEMGALGQSAMFMLGFTEVHDYNVNVDGQGREYATPAEHTRVTALQMLLRRHLKAARSRAAGIDAEGHALYSRYNRLETLTRARQGQGGHSTSSQEAAFAVFGDEMFFNYLSETDAALLGSGSSMRELVNDLNSMTEADAKQWLTERRQATNTNASLSNPPYRAEDLASGKVTAARLILDTVETMWNLTRAGRRGKSAEVGKELAAGIKALQEITSTWGNTLPTDVKAAFSDVQAETEEEQRGLQVLMYLDNDEMGLIGKLAEVFGSNDAIARTAISVAKDTGKVFVAPWFLEVLGSRPEKAVAKFVVYSALAEYSLADRVKAPKNSKLTQDELADEVARQVADAAEQDAEALMSGRRARNYAKLRTGAARTLFTAGSRHPLIAKELIQQLFAADSLEMVTDILNDPVFRGEGMEVTPFADDVTEMDVSDVTSWQSISADAQARKSIAEFTQAAIKANSRAHEIVTIKKENEATARGVIEYLSERRRKARDGDSVDTRSSAVNVRQQRDTINLLRTLQNAQRIHTVAGPGIRTNFLEAATVGSVAYYEKGKAAPESAQVSVPHVTGVGGTTEFSVMAAVTSAGTVDFEQIRRNPSLLAAYDMEIMLPSGAVVNWDLPGKLQQLYRANPVGNNPAALLEYADILEEVAKLFADPTTSSMASMAFGLNVFDSAGDGISTRMLSSTLAPARENSDSATGGPLVERTLAEILEGAQFHGALGPNGLDMSPTQAHAVISLIEGGVRKAVEGKDATEQALGFYPLTLMVQELLNARTMKLRRPLVEGSKELREMVDEATVDVAKAVLLLAETRAARGTEGLQEVLRGLRVELTPSASSTGEAAVVRRLANRPVGLSDKDWAVERHNIVAAHLLELEGANSLRQTALATSGLPEAEIKRQVAELQEAYHSQRDSFETLVDAIQDGDTLFDAVARKFLLEKDSKGKIALTALNAAKQRDILIFLGSQGRMRRLTSKIQGLWDEVNDVIATSDGHTFKADSLTDKHWEAMAYAAASLAVAEQYATGGSQVSVQVVQPDAAAWDDLRRYHDDSWAFLLDRALLPNTLDAAEFVIRQAGWTSNVQAKTEERVKVLRRTVFKEDKLHRWNHLFVRGTILTRNLLFGGGVEVAVGIAGGVPETQATMMESNRRTYDLLPKAPEASRISAGTLSGREGSRFMARLDGRFVDSSQGVRLFVDGGPPEGIDLAARSSRLLRRWGSDENPQTKAIRDSSYRVMSAHALQEAIRSARAELVAADPSLKNASWSVEMAVVRPEDRPYTAPGEGVDWTHNVLYSGVGRSLERDNYPSLMAEMVYEGETQYTLDTQNPLDTIKKSRLAFLTQAPIARAAIRRINRSKKSTFEKLSEKAYLILRVRMSSGVPHTADLNAIMETLRALHFVVVRDKHGNVVERWPVDRQIAAETHAARVAQGLAQEEDGEMPLRDAHLMSLSTSAYLSMAHDRTGRSANRTDLPTLDRRGGTTRLDYSTEGVQAALLPELGAMPKVGKRTISSIYRELFSQPVTLGPSSRGPRAPEFNAARDERQKRISRILDLRSSEIDSRKNTRFYEHNQERARNVGRFLEDVMESERVASIFTEHSAYAGATRRQTGSAALNEALNVQTNTPGQVPWILVHEDPASSRTIGVPGFLLDTDLSKSRTGLPVNGEHVVVDLATYGTSRLDEHVVRQQLESALKQLMHRGATISFVNLAHYRFSRETLDFMRAMTPDYLTTDGITFRPDMEEDRRALTEKVLERTRTEAHEFDVTNHYLSFFTNFFGELNENLGSLNDRADGIAQPIMKVVSMSRRPRGFVDLPSAKERWVAQNTLLPVLQDAEMFESLLKDAGGEGARADLVRLRAQLEALASTSEPSKMGWPTDEGQRFKTGSFYVLKNKGMYYIARAGYESLTYSEAKDQARTRGDAAVGVKVAIAPNKKDNSINGFDGVIEKSEPHESGGNRRFRLRMDLRAMSAKVLANLDGMKVGVVRMPEGIRFPERGIGRGDKKVQPTLMEGKQANESKQSFSGLGDSMRELFAIFGADHRADILEALTGTRPSEKTLEAEWSDVAPLLEQMASVPWPVTEDEVADMLSGRNPALPTFSSLLSDGMISDELITQEFADFMQRFEAGGMGSNISLVNGTPGQLIGRRAILSLLAPGVQLRHIASTKGYVDITPASANRKVMVMPSLFTDSLLDIRLPDLREELFSRLNTRAGAVDGDYEIRSDGTLWVYMESDSGRIAVPGSISLRELYLDDVHPDIDAAVARGKTSADLTQYGATQTDAMLGSPQRPSPKKIADAEMLAELNRLALEDHNDVDSFFNSFMEPGAKLGSPFAAAQLASDMKQRANDRRTHAHNLVPIDTSSLTADEMREYTRAARALSVRMFGSSLDLPRIEYLLRVVLGARGRDERNPAEVNISNEIRFENLMETFQAINGALSKGLFPWAITPQRVLVDASFFKVFYTSQKEMKTGWTPANSFSGSRIDADASVEEWFLASLGQLEQAPRGDARVAGFYKGDSSGSWNTYGELFEGMLELSPTLDDDIELLKHYNVESEDFTISMDAAVRRASIKDGASPLVGPSSLSILTGNPDEVGQTLSGTRAQAQRLQHVLAVLREENIPSADPMQSGRDFMTEGAQLLERNTAKHKVLQTLTDIRVVTTLADGALITGGWMDLLFRGTAELAVDVLTGRTVPYNSVGGKLISFLHGQGGRETEAAARLASDKTLMLAERALERLANSREFAAHLRQELLYQASVKDGGVGFINKAAGAFARAQDPFAGPLGKFYAKLYLDAAATFIAQHPDSNMTLDQLLTRIDQDPMFLEKLEVKDNRTGKAMGLSAHRAGTVAVGNVRSSKKSLGGEVLLAMPRKLALSNNFAVAMSGHMLLWPVQFANFNANHAMNLTGMGVIHDLMVSFMHGREANGFLRKLTPFVSGGERTEHFDMGDFMQGLDLQRSFARSGITWSTFALYLMSGGIGLSGEDEEARRRRLMEESLNLPRMYDPRDIANDWRNADFMFLNGLPGPLESLAAMAFGEQQVRDEDGNVTDSYIMMQPHWVMRAYMSPFLGLERFMQTGDTRNIIWGFEDALSVMPTSLVNSFVDTRDVALTALGQANELAAEGNPNDTPEIQRLIMSTVLMYQRTLFESNFLNTIRNGSDEYRRDPWVNVQRKPDGSVVYGEDGEPMPTKELVSYVDENGETRQGYERPDWTEGTLRSHAAKNAVFATVASVFTGGTDESPFLRRNMIPKEEEVPLRVLEENLAESYVLDTWSRMNKKAQGLALTPEEASKLLRAQKFAAGDYTGLKDEDLAGESVALAQGLGSDMVLKKHEVRGLFASTFGGLLSLDKMARAPLAIDYDTRVALGNEIFTDLVNEGIAWGLDELTANKRAERLWNGWSNTDSTVVGYKDIVWSDQIARRDVATYRQLNTGVTMGPGGKAYATGAKPFGITSALGLNIFGVGMVAPAGGMGTDNRLNSVDNVLDLNTGMRALERKEEEPLKPVEPKMLKQQSFSSGGGGYSRGYRRSGGSGGYRSSGYWNVTNPYFVRFQAPEPTRAVYGDNLPRLGTPEPLLRRANIRRERISSARGRLMQWQ